MFLTEPHPVDIEARKKVCLDIVAKYGQGYRVLIKPHPRDMIDYTALLSGLRSSERTIPD